MTGIAAIIGGGVVGAGWTARFALMGWQVRVFDPDPGAPDMVDAVLHAARASLPGLVDAPMPDEGHVTFSSRMSEAVDGAAWVQESVPERLELKQTLYQTLQSHAAPEAIIASSTSGFTPTDLQARSRRPGQIIVAHPCVPVYLLPGVELVGNEANPPEMLDRAEDMLGALGMFPLRLQKEIDAHIADRLLDAVWRESLWLIRDGIATTGQIDDAIRMGFGLRWAQMGLFETCRLGGGAAGLRDALGQSGPAQKSPRTRPTDMPDLTDELLETIAAQSDEQSAMHDIADLARIRDANLVALLRALKQQGWGAGKVFSDMEARLSSAAPASVSGA